jgi:hypothetical protein
LSASPYVPDMPCTDCLYRPATVDASTCLPCPASLHALLPACLPHPDLPASLYFTCLLALPCLLRRACSLPSSPFLSAFPPSNCLLSCLRTAAFLAMPTFVPLCLPACLAVSGPALLNRRLQPCFGCLARSAANHVPPTFSLLSCLPACLVVSLRASPCLPASLHCPACIAPLFRQCLPPTSCLHRTALPHFVALLCLQSPMPASPCPPTSPYVSRPVCLPNPSACVSA